MIPLELIGLIMMAKLAMRQKPWTPENPMGVFNPVRSGAEVVGRRFANAIANGMFKNGLPGRKRRFLEYCSVLGVTLFLRKCNFQ